MSDERRRGRDWDPKPLAALLDKLVQQRGWQERVAVGRLRACWAEAVGPEIAARSEPVRLEDGVLVVRAEGAWATELALMSKRLATKVDERLGGGIVREVKVLGGAPDKRRGRR